MVQSSHFGEEGEQDTHCDQLPIVQVEQKLDNLVAKIQASLTIRTNPFRTRSVQITAIDSNYWFSWFSWTLACYPFYQMRYSLVLLLLYPYGPDLNALCKISSRQIFELPVTVGFKSSYNFEFLQGIHQACSLHL